MTTGYDYSTAPATNFSPITVFTNPTVYLLLSALVGYLWYRWKNCYRKTEHVGKDVVTGVASNALSPTLAIFTFLTLAQMLLFSGKNTILALGISAVTAPWVYVALAPWIGGASVFLTTSAVAGNTLGIPR